MQNNKKLIYKNTWYLIKYILSSFIKIIIILNIVFIKNDIFALDIWENINNKCLITNSQAPIIKEYAKKVDKFISEINKNCEKQEYTQEQIKNFNIKAINNVMTWSIAYKEIYSYLWLRNTNFYYFRFEEENKNIYNIYIKTNQNLANILKNCNKWDYEWNTFKTLKWKTKLQAATSVMQNSIKVWDLYHNILLWNLTYNKLDTKHTEYNNIFWLWKEEDYIKELNNYYWLDAFKICELETDNAKDSARLIKEISKNNIEYSSIFEKWKIASLKLAGIYWNEKQERKKELNKELKERLQEENNAINKIKTNLENSNNKDQELNTWNKWIKKSATDSINKNTFNNKDDINKIIKAVKEINNTDSMIVNDDDKRNSLMKYAKLLNRYASRRSIAESNNYRTNIAVQNLLKAHISLTKTLKLITETIDLSEQVCNSQATWLWICEY